jgi:hypothetical protein
VLVFRKSVHISKGFAMEILRFCVPAFDSSLYERNPLVECLAPFSVKPLPDARFDLSFVEIDYDAVCEEVGNTVACFAVAPLRSPVLLFHAIAQGCFPKDRPVCSFWGIEKGENRLPYHGWLKKEPGKDLVYEEVVFGNYIPNGYYVACYKAKKC